MIFSGRTIISGGGGRTPWTTKNKNTFFIKGKNGWKKYDGLGGSTPENTYILCVFPKEMQETWKLRLFLAFFQIPGNPGMLLPDSGVSGKMATRATSSIQTGSKKSGVYIRQINKITN